MADPKGGAYGGFTTRVIGAHRVGNRLRTAAAQLPQTTDRVTGGWARNVRKVLKSKKYPAKIPGQKYIRTGRLASSWKAVRLRQGSWAIQNMAAKNGRIYSGWVVFQGTQAEVHEGRWWTGQEVIQSHIPDLTKELSQELSTLPPG